MLSYNKKNLLKKKNKRSLSEKNLCKRLSFFKYFF